MANTRKDSRSLRLFPHHAVCCGMKRSFTAVRKTLILALSIMLPLVLACPASAQTVKIGVLAYKGKDIAMKMWTPTATYLQKSIPGASVEIVPLTFNEVNDAVQNSRIDFIIANSSIYVELEARYGVTRIATMKNQGFKGSSTVFGGTIFSRAGRDDLKTLADIRGKTFLAVDETSLGGWRAAWGEFHAAGINPYRDLKSLAFTDNHESVVFAVREGKADAGTVRTDTLERMAEDGKISLQEFKIINPRTEHDFPFLLSTRLYPEWPIARLEKTPEEIAKKVVIALMNMPRGSRAAEASKTFGWTIPLDYQAVHDLLKVLGLSPYQNYGKVTFSQSIRQYWYITVLVILTLAIMTFVILHILKLNRNILLAKRDAEDARNNLEQQVVARTADLRDMNSELMHEIGVRKQTEEKLLIAERERSNQLNFLQSIIDSVPDPIMVISPDYRIKLLNVQAKTDMLADGTFCYQVSHRAGSPCNDDGHPCPLRDVLNKKTPSAAVHTHTGASGIERTVEITASPIFDSAGDVAYVIELCKDITEKIRLAHDQKRADQRLFHQQKEESITTLAGGIAHDFNNILMGVLGNAELLKLKLQLKPDESRPIDSIISGVERMADLTRQMLAYAKEGKYQLKNVALDSALRKALDLSHKGRASAIKITVSIPGDLWPVMADENQVIQAFVNLCNNAFEATEELGGTLAVSAENLEARPSWTCWLHHEHPAGDYVSLSFTDTGSGISPAIADKIFDPFVTTKFMGRGLGLSAVLGIVQNHGGCILFSSKEGEGSSFQLLFPRSEKAAESLSVSTTAPPVSAKKQVLIVDDEPDILILLQSALLSFGFDVVAVDTGEKAVESVQAYPDRIDSVILDLQLPGISGRETFKRLKELKPGIKVIISTGYDLSAALTEISPLIPEGFIQKPYKLSLLEEKLREILM